MEIFGSSSERATAGVLAVKATKGVCVEGKKKMEADFGTPWAMPKILPPVQSPEERGAYLAALADDGRCLATFRFSFRWTDGPEELE